MSGSIPLHARHAYRLFCKRNALPLYLTLFVTDRCNQACLHCFRADQQLATAQEMTLEQYQRTARSLPHLTCLDLTGGEPFLRNDLADIAAAFCTHCHVQNLSIVTNGWQTDRIAAVSAAIAGRCPATHISVIVSIDGNPDTHDRIRGCPGAYEHATQSVAALKALHRVHPNLQCGVAMTLMKENEATLHQSYPTIRDQLQPRSISLTLARGHSRDPDQTTVDIAVYERLARQIEADTDHPNTPGFHGFSMARIVPAMKHELHRVTAQVARDPRQAPPCYAGRLSGVIYPGGDIYACELLDRRLGHLAEFDYNLPQLWRSASARAVVDGIVNCSCIHDCNLSCNILFTPRHALRILARTVLKGRRRAS